MKITKQRLRQIIKEEFEATISENPNSPSPGLKWPTLRRQYDTGHSSQEEREKKEAEDPNIHIKRVIASYADELIKLVSQNSNFEARYQEMLEKLAAIEEVDEEISDLKQQAIADVQAL